jgi:hypothetical protein
MLCLFYAHKIYDCGDDMVKIMSMVKVLSQKGITGLQQFGKKNNAKIIMNIFGKNMESEIDVLLCLINAMLKYVKFDCFKDDGNVRKNIKNNASIESFCKLCDLDYGTIINFFNTYVKFIEENTKIMIGIENLCIQCNVANHMFNKISIEGLKKCNYKYTNVHLCLMLGYPYNFAKRISNIDSYFNVYAPSTLNILHLATMKYKGPQLQLIINTMHVAEYIFYLDSDMTNKSLFVSRVNKSIFSELLKNVYKRDVIKKNISDVMKNHEWKSNDDIEYKVAINFINAIKIMLTDLKKLKL